MQRQLSWPTSSVIPNDTLSNTVNEFVELLGRESRSSLAWQWSLQGAKAIDVTFKFSHWDHCLMSYDTRER
jgi:hypothetical protein